LAISSLVLLNFCQGLYIVFVLKTNSKWKIFITVFDVSLFSNIFFKFDIMKYEKKKNNKYEFVVHTNVYPKDLEK
jgi:hypothetical protein